jgi:hypothetical protein
LLLRLLYLYLNTNIYVTSSSLCTLYRSINIVTCQVIETSFINTWIYRSINRSLVTVHKGKNLKWVTGIQKFCKRL